MTKPFAPTWKKALTGTAVLAVIGGLFVGQGLAAVTAEANSEYLEVAQASAGNTHAAILTTGGDVYVKGWNNQGQLGLDAGSRVNIREWTHVNIEEPVAYVDVRNHATAITTNGHVFTWGANDAGQTGDGSTNPAFTPKQVTAATRYKQIAAGQNHVIAVDSNGVLWGWGNNKHGQVGNNTTENVKDPVALNVSARFKKVYASANTSYAIDQNNRLWAWGVNDAGQYGNGSTDSSLVPVQTSDTAWEKIAVNVNSDTVVALTLDNWLHTWGANTHGELGVGVDWRQQQRDENARVEAEKARIKQEDLDRKNDLIETCAVKKTDEQKKKDEEEAKKKKEEEEEDKKKEEEENNQKPEEGDGETPPVTPPVTPPTTPTPQPDENPVPDSKFMEECTKEVEKDFKETDVSGLKPAVIKEPELKPGSLTPQLVTPHFQFLDIALGSENAYAVDVLNRGYSWGTDKNGQNGNDLAEDSHTQVPVVFEHNMATVVAGDRWAAATSTENALLVWGVNSNGELLSDPAKERRVLKPVKRGNGWTSLVAGEHTVYAQSGGNNFAWGAGTDGQTGSGASKDAFSPQQLTEKVHVVAPYRGGAVGLSYSDQFQFWGTNKHDEHGGSSDTGTVLNTVTMKTVDTFKAAAAGVRSSYAVDVDGVLWGWGDNSTKVAAPQSGNGVELFPVRVGIGGNDVTDVAAGLRVATAVTSEGVLVWGKGFQELLPVKDVKKLSAGYGHVSILTNKGDLYEWSAEGEFDEEFEARELITREGSFVDVSAVANYTAAVSTSGAVALFGSHYPELPDTLHTDAVTVSAANTYIIITDNKAAAWGWGENQYNVLGDKTLYANITPLSALQQKEETE